jgi:coenzyme F420-reducing hydrogenase alpha subunit
MKIDLNVDVHHLTRVEGHGNIRVRVRDGKVAEAAWEVVETPRFFEVMLQGKHYSSAGILTARICGICSIGHCLASVRASERAFGVTPPPVASQLRLLAKHGETLQSHVLHLFLLAAPDFLGLPSVIPLLHDQPAVFHVVRRLKGLGNRICDAVAGRTTHPVSIQVGGMAQRPAVETLRAVRRELTEIAPDLQAAADLLTTFDIPDFARETEFVSLKAEAPAGTLGRYPWIGGRLVSSDGVEKSEDDYAAMTNEYVTEDNTSKWCKLSRDAMAVGALARLNNNYDTLGPEAKLVAEQLGLAPVSHNPFLNNVAQLVECVHVVHESVALIDAILDTPEDAPLMAAVTPTAGEGTAAVEVPRGILYHHYRYDGDGRVARADCVIPTTQNNANIHLDLHSLAAQLAREGRTDAELERLCTMLVRAYDPCISCSVH